MNQKIFHAATLALAIAKKYEGATSPNPPVGAVGLTKEGDILGLAAHERGGAAHAEANLIQKLSHQGTLEALHTLIVTLEPCNHYGKTPPCVKTILETNVKAVIVGCLDPNPLVNGKGFRALKEKVNTHYLSEYASSLSKECENLIIPYRYWLKHGKPWVIVKRAFNAHGSMIPKKNQKTFTSEKSLRLAHNLRRRADAILTGSGTVLVDNPEFTVRLVPDHVQKQRWLVLFDRRKRIPIQWKERATRFGFRLIEDLEFEEALCFLGQKGTHLALVEAGPTLSEYVLRNNFWNQRVDIFQSKRGCPDQIFTTFNELN